MNYAGDVRSLDNCYSEIINNLVTLNADDDTYEKIVKMMRKLNCTGGALRIAEALHSDL